MSIRTKTVVAIFLAMTLTLLGLFWVARSVLVEQFNTLEQEQSLVNVERVRASFEDIFAQMTSKSADWAGWDDAYTFVQDGNQEFRDANLYQNAAEQIEVNLIAYFAKDKRPLKGGSFAWNPPVDVEGTMPIQDPSTLFAPDSWFLSFDKEDEIRTGFLQSPAGPFFVVSRAVFNTDLDKPAMGYLIFAKLLDQKVVENRMELTKFPLSASLIRNGRPDQDAFLAPFQSVLKEPLKRLLIPINEQQLRAYLLFEDWEKSPVYIVGMNLERPILAQGMRTIRLLMIAFAVISVLSGILVVSLLEKIVITRLYRLKRNVSAVTQTKPRQHQIPVEGKDEIRRVGDAINVMLEELDQQNRQIDAMLSNMSQGLCTVDEFGNLRGEASAYFWELFPREKHEDFNVVKEVFEGSNLASDELEMIRSLLEVSVGETVFNFEMNSENLPTRFSREISGTLHHFECDWSIITSQDRDTVQSVLITFRDVTRLRELQSANEKERRSMSILLLILKMGSERYSLYIKAAQAYLAACLTTVRQAQWTEAAHIALKRDLHTIKGNSRVYGLTEIASHIHSLEELLGRREDAWTHAPEIIQGLEQLAQLFNELDHAAQILGYVAGEGKSPIPSLQVPTSLVDETLALIESLKHKLIDESPALKSLALSYRRLLSFPMESLCQDLRSMGQTLSKELDLKNPTLSLKTSSPLYLERDAASKLRDVLVHMVRNSLYHGFKGLPLDQPQIEMRSEFADQWHLLYLDNGKGLNCRKLRELGQQRGILGVESWSPQQLVELIFEEGVSTAEAVNSVSGRGTGMGAVRAMVEELGGKLLPELGTENESGYAPLRFRLVLPFDCLIGEDLATPARSYA